MHQILTDGLAVISPEASRAPRSTTEQMLQPLRKSVDRLQAVISSYQTHEAREILCQDLAQQIERLRGLKEELTRYGVMYILSPRLHTFDLR